MKFLIDMNLSPSWVEALTRLGHSGVHWSSIGAADAEDTVIAAYAPEHRLIVLTNDLDFGKILSDTGLSLPSVIQLRLGDLRPVVLLETMQRVVVATEADLARGALVTVGSRRVRIASLPLQGEEPIP